LPFTPGNVINAYQSLTGSSSARCQRNQNFKWASRSAGPGGDRAPSVFANEPGKPMDRFESTRKSAK